MSAQPAEVVPPALVLTATETQLIDDLKLGGHGLANHGVRMFKDQLIYYLGELYEWSLARKLWKVAKTGVIQYQFATSVLNATGALEPKVRTEQERLEKLDESKAIKSQLAQCELILGYIGAARKIMIDASKQTAVWRLVQGRIIESDGRLLNNYNDVLPLSGGKKLNLRTGDIAERTPVDLWSYEIPCTGLSFNEEEEKVVKWCYENFARDQEGTLDVDYLRYLKELHAYWATFEIGDKSFCQFTGESHGGKSFLFSLLSLVLGQRVGVCSVEVFTDLKNDGHKTYFKDLEQKSMVYADDITQGSQFNVGQLKRLTGGGVVPYRVAYGAEIRKLMPGAKPNCSVNGDGSFNGGDSGMATRFIKLPFNFIHKKGSKTSNAEKIRLLTTSQGCRNAILKWILEGTIEMFRRIDNNEPYLIPSSNVQEATTESLELNDPFLLFLEEECEIWTPDSNAPRSSFKFPRRSLQNTYTMFMNKHPEIKGKRMDSTGVKDRMLQRFVDKNAKSGDWIGVRAKDKTKDCDVAQVEP